MRRRSSSTFGPQEPGGVLVGGVAWGAALTVAVLVCLAYACGIVVPYYVNDLDALTLAEVSSGAHDPKDLWPATTGYGGWLIMAGVFAVFTTFFLLVPVAIAALHHLVSCRSQGLACCWPSAPIVVITAALLAVQLSPFGLAVLDWIVD